MPRTKVVEFITNMGDGGAETLVKDYMLLLDREKIEVCAVICFDDADSANLRRLRERNISVISLDPGRNLFYRVWRKLNQPHYYGHRFLHLVKKQNITVVHAHLEVLDFLAQVSQGLKGIRLFHTCHAPAEKIYRGKEKTAAEKLIRENHMGLIALHEDMARELNELFSVTDTAVIRNGIDLGRFADPGVTRAEKRKELAIPADAFVLGHVGRFAEVKNHDFLAEVFREVALRRGNAFLLMVGTGDPSAIEEKLKNYGLGDRYRILSGRTDINEILTAMDAFAFPSHHEGLGIALVEAQAAGLRCVASTGVPEEAFRTELCFRLPPQDPARWAELLLSHEKHPAAKDLSVYDMNREIKRLEELYLGVKS